MGTQATRGFTIIETMLVLAITGLMVAGILVGVGTQIGIQRYRDAVQTFKTTLQNQYSEITSVQNDRQDTWECNETGVTSETGSIGRGQSDCILVGRLVSIEGGSILISSLVARPVATPNPNLNDLESLRENYILNIATNTQEETAMEWGTQIAWPLLSNGDEDPRSPRNFSMMVIRSPDSGQVYTFTGDDAISSPNPASLRSLIVGGSGSGNQREQILCIASIDTAVNDDYSVILAPFASTPNALETSTNDLLSQLERSERC